MTKTYLIPLQRVSKHVRENIKNIKMKNIFSVITLLLSNILFCQSKDEYKLLNEAIPSLFNLVKADNITVYENQIEFPKQKEFFSKEFLTNYTFRTIDVDSKKVKKLIKKLNFTYLSNQRQKIEKWEVAKINYAVNFSVAEDKTQKLYKVSSPIFDESKKWAFIYYEELIVNGNYTDSASGTVKVYEKKHGKWKFYVQIPIYIS